MTARRVGIFGGTFDPIHVGHLAAAEDAAWRLTLEQVLFVPNNVPPHKLGREVSPTSHRVAMVEAAVADNPLFAVSRVEIERGGISYSLDTLRVLRTRFGPSAHLLFLTGVDALPELHTWHCPEDLLEEFEVVFLCRPDARSLDWKAIEARFAGLRDRVRIVGIPELEVSGTDIRERVREGRPIRYYVTPPVQEYIARHGLYRG
jgi:nicotinate-nucleotide adenylyltransferase